MKIKLQERHLYGRLVYYPEDEAARKLLEETNRILVLHGFPMKKCFNEKQLSEFRNSGYEIQIDPFDYVAAKQAQKINHKS